MRYRYKLLLLFVQILILSTFEIAHEAHCSSIDRSFYEKQYDRGAKKVNYYTHLATPKTSNEMQYEASELDSDLFVAKNIAAYVATGDYRTAQAKAIQNAIRDGLERVLQRVCLDAQVAYIEMLRSDNISNFVEKIRTKYERVNRKSYRGIFDIYFKKNEIEADMSRRGLRFGTKIQQNILFVPLLIEDGDYTLFDGNQEWLGAWIDMKRNIGLAETDVVGNIAILNSKAIGLSEANMKTLIGSSYKKIAKTFGLDNSSTAVIVEAKYLEKKRLNVNVHILNADKEKRFNTAYAKRAGESESAFFSRIADEVGINVNRLLQGAKPMSNHQSIVHIINDDVAKWAQIRDKLDETNAIKYYRIRKNDGRSIELELHYGVDPKSLSTLLLKHGLLVIDKEIDENKKGIVLELKN